MKNVSTVTNIARVATVLLATSLGFATTAANATDSTEAYDNITVTQQVSASGAKRLARKFLTERGFKMGIGPGAARIRSVTRDGDTWILQVRYSHSGYIMNQKAMLYVDANAALVSETAPPQRAEQVAAQ
jgi:hypothetical protein